MNIHCVFLLLGLLAVAGTLVSLRQEHIRTEYSIGWLVVGVVLATLAAFPGLLDRAARNLGPGPEACFLIAGGTLISVLIFEITHVVSRLRDENVMLAQRVASLEFQILETGRQNGSQGPVTGPPGVYQ